MIGSPCPTIAGSTGPASGARNVIALVDPSANMKSRATLTGDVFIRTVGGAPAPPQPITKSATSATRTGDEPLNRDSSIGRGSNSPLRDWRRALSIPCPRWRAPCRIPRQPQPPSQGRTSRTALTPSAHRWRINSRKLDQVVGGFDAAQPPAKIATAIASETGAIWKCLHARDPRAHRHRGRFRVLDRSVFLRVNPTGSTSLRRCLRWASKGCKRRDKEVCALAGEKATPRHYSLRPDNSAMLDRYAGPHEFGVGLLKCRQKVADGHPSCLLYCGQSDQLSSRGTGFSSLAELDANSWPQYRQTRASGWTCSAQRGHFFKPGPRGAVLGLFDRVPKSRRRRTSAKLIRMMMVRTTF